MRNGSKTLNTNDDTRKKNWQNLNNKLVGKRNFTAMNANLARIDLLRYKEVDIQPILFINSVVRYTSKSFANYGPTSFQKSNTISKILYECAFISQNFI